MIDSEAQVAGSKGGGGSGPLSVARVLNILSVLSQSDEPLNLAELSRRLAAPKTSLIGLLRGLAEMNFVQFSDGAYRLGGASFELASAVLSARQRLHLGDYVRAGMKELNKRTGETVLYAVITGDDPPALTYVALDESRSAIRISVGIGDRSPLYSTAGGRILLAAMPDDEVRAYLARVPIVATTASTVTDPDTLFAHVCKAREEDFSCVRDEMVSGVTGMAVPIRDSAEGVIGSIIIAGPTERMAAEEQELRAAMLATARATSRSIGHNAGTAAGK